MPASTPPVRRPGTSPPGPIFLTLLGALALLTCWAVSAPAGYFLLLLAAALAWCALAAIWGIWLLLALARRPGRDGLRRRWRQWLFAPVVAVFVAGNVALDAPLRMRHALSEPALRAAAEALIRGESVDPGRHGLYVLTATEPLPGRAARFQVRGTGFLETSGFAYSPAGPPPARGSDRYEHLTGPWYTWVNCWD